MTANKIITKAMSLLGYTNKFGTPDTESYTASYKNSLTYLNECYFELAEIEGETFAEITDLSSEPDISEKACFNVLPFGVAMWIAFNENDGDKYNNMSFLYSQKKAGLVRPPKTVTNSFTTLTIQNGV